MKIPCSYVAVGAALLGACFSGALPAVGAEGEGTPLLRVLFLGDTGHHQPADRFKQLEPVLRRHRIELDYTESLDDLSPEKLAGYDCLVIYANWTKISPGQEKALRDFADRELGRDLRSHETQCEPDRARRAPRQQGRRALHLGAGTRPRQSFLYRLGPRRAHLVECRFSDAGREWHPLGIGEFVRATQATHRVEALRIRRVTGPVAELHAERAVGNPERADSHDAKAARPG